MQNRSYSIVAVWVIGPTFVIISCLIFIFIYVANPYELTGVWFGAKGGQELFAL